jgi:hypothetical protein
MAKARLNWGPTDEYCSVRLFVVHNTAHRSLYVLSRDERTAMSVAYAANHVYSPEIKYADGYSRSVYEILSPSGYGLADHWSLIREAIAQRLEGTVHIEDDDICVGSQLFFREKGGLSG